MRVLRKWVIWISICKLRLNQRPLISQLLVNPYSRRLDEVRASRLFAFTAHNKPRAIIDLHRLETPASGYVLWGDFSRKDDATVLAELKKRHPDSDFQLFDMMSSIGHIRMDA